MIITPKVIPTTPHRTVYTVPKEVRDEFLKEAKVKGVRILEEIGEFFIADTGAPDLVWATDISFKAMVFDIPSIAHGAKNLRAMTQQKTHWQLLEGNLHRRATLIAEAIGEREMESFSYAKAPLPRRGLEERNGAMNAAFFLISLNQGIALLDSLARYPGAAIPLREEKIGPPSRAYLKLWEAFARIGDYPAPGARVLDLGSCPGGWTWVLAKLGCEVLSMDGAPLEPTVAAMPGVTFKKGDAFNLTPAEATAHFGGNPIDWIFSDMICEPKRLVTLLQTWLKAGVCSRFIISVKFKGEADPEVIRELSELGGRLRHLRQNKHELTWIRMPAT